MSKVYHGSIEEVRNPEIRQPNRSLDYGSGFYTTTSYEQAKKWVERRMKDKGYFTKHTGFTSSGKRPKALIRGAIVKPMVVTS